MLIFNAPLDADSYSNAQGKERVGGYTFQNFKGNAALSFVGYNTTVNIKDNELSFLGLSLANVKANVIGNTIDAQNTSHKIWGGGNSEYGFYLYAADYDLVFSGNTVKNTNSHAVGINGRMQNPGWPGHTSNADTVAENSVIFTGNTISDYKNNKAALKIWDDTYYAQQKMTSEAELNGNAKRLIQHVLAAESENSITKPADGAFVFNFYDYAFDNLNG